MYNYLTYIDNFPIGDRKLIYDFFSFVILKSFQIQLYLFFFTY